MDKLNINCATNLSQSDNKLTKRGIITALHQYSEYRGIPWYLFLRQCMKLPKSLLLCYLDMAKGVRHEGKE